MTRASAAVVLAAGEGRRMGGPKALLVIDGRPLVARVVERLRAAGCASIVVVARPAVAREVRAALGEALAGVTVLAAETASPASSLRAGVRELASHEPRGDRVVIVSPVDLVPPRRSTLAALLEALDARDTHVATPRHAGRGGHPVVLREALLRAFALTETGTLRDLLALHEAHRRRVDVDDAAVLGDLDTPRDLATLRPGLEPIFAA